MYIGGFRDFNPHSSYEERRHGLEELELDEHFNPHSSYEERLRFYGIIVGKENFNPHSSYEERQYQS